jgi:hypothetical protein
MDALYLQDWSDRERVFRLLEHELVPIDPETVDWPGKLSGYAFEYRGDIYGVYAIDSSFCFFANGHTWRVAEVALVADYKRIVLLERFSIRVAGVLVLSTRYWRAEALRSVVLDPAFDGFDEDRHFFLQWCARVLNKPAQQKALVERWRSWRWKDGEQ